MVEHNCTQDAEKQAKSILLREHLAELRDWYREEEKENSNSKANKNEKV